METLQINSEKLFLASLVSMAGLLLGASMSSNSCNAQTPLWNQQIQSSANFGSVVLLKPVVTKSPVIAYRCQ